MSGLWLWRYPALDIGFVKTDRQTEKRERKENQKAIQPCGGQNLKKVSDHNLTFNCIHTIINDLKAAKTLALQSIQTAALFLNDLVSSAEIPSAIPCNQVTERE